MCHIRFTALIVVYYLLLLCRICYVDSMNRVVLNFIDIRNSHILRFLHRVLNWIFVFNLKQFEVSENRFYWGLLDWISILDAKNKSNLPVLFARCWPNFLCSHFAHNPAISIDYTLAHLPFFVLLMHLHPHSVTVMAGQLFTDSSRQNNLATTTTIKLTINIKK